VSDAVFFLGAWSVPVGLIVFATRRALRAIDAQYERATREAS
jgi:hypothetical protein